MERMRPFLEEAGITEAGAVSFESCLPLLPCRATLRLPEKAASVVICAFPYYTGEWKGRNLSRYAIVPDYHRVIASLLEPVCERLAEAFPGHRFVSFADNSPVREVDAAARAGLGVVGENGLLLHKRYGSWVFLGEIVTDLPLSFPEQPAERCIGCGACKRNCPSGCIGSGTVDASACLSAVTQRKGELLPEEIRLVQKGGLVWGCDRCQEVCPYNRDVPETPLSSFREKIHPVLRREEVTAAVKTKAYGFRGPKPLLRNLDILQGKIPTE